MRRRLALGVACVWLAAAGGQPDRAQAAQRAAGGADVDAAASVDARFDRTGDGIVDAADWPRLSVAEQRAYAWAALAALGEDPYTRIEGETTRGDRFLAGLRSVYGSEARPTRRRASGRR